VEFVDYGEAVQLLNEQGIYEVTEGDRTSLALEETDDIVHLHMASTDSQTEPLAGAEVMRFDKTRLPAIVENILHKLHLTQVLMIPVAKWRKVFDAVAFSLADNEEWQAVDTAATVALNTRDPLLCEPQDFHTIAALIGALFADAESPDQSVVLVTTGAPVLIEIVPDGAVRCSIGNAVLADEVVETFGTPK